MHIKMRFDAHHAKFSCNSFYAGMCPLLGNDDGDAFACAGRKKRNMSRQHEKSIISMWNKGNRAQEKYRDREEEANKKKERRERTSNRFKIESYTEQMEFEVLFIFFFFFIFVVILKRVRYAFHLLFVSVRKCKVMDGE